MSAGLVLFKLAVADSYSCSQFYRSVYLGNVRTVKAEKRNLGIVPKGGGPFVQGVASLVGSAARQANSCTSPAHPYPHLQRGVTCMRRVPRIPPLKFVCLCWSAFEKGTLLAAFFGRPLDTHFRGAGLQLHRFHRCVAHTQALVQPLQSVVPDDRYLFRLAWKHFPVGGNVADI